MNWGAKRHISNGYGYLDGTVSCSRDDKEHFQDIVQADVAGCINGGFCGGNHKRIRSPLGKLS